MLLCRVLGNVVATEKHPAFHALKMLVVQPLDEQKKNNGQSFLAVDHSSLAGEGDLVLVLREGTGVRQILNDKTLPIRSMVVGVVDQLDVESEVASPPTRSAERATGASAARAGATERRK